MQSNRQRGQRSNRSDDAPADLPDSYQAGSTAADETASAATGRRRPRSALESWSVSDTWATPERARPERPAIAPPEPPKRRRRGSALDGWSVSETWSWDWDETEARPVEPAELPSPEAEPVAVDRPPARSARARRTAADRGRRPRPVKRSKPSKPSKPPKRSTPSQRATPPKRSTPPRAKRPRGRSHVLPARAPSRASRLDPRGPQTAARRAHGGGSRAASAAPARFWPA